MSTPVCTRESPYRGTYSSHHPDSSPTRVDAKGNLIAECPNCRRVWHLGIPADDPEFLKMFGGRP